MKRNLCKKCYIDLEEIYDRAGIHKYIRDNGLPDNFSPERFAEELGLNPRYVALLYDLGFFERDIQVYKQGGKDDREKLAEELSLEVNKMRNKKRAFQAQEREIKTPPKNISYGGSIYRRRGRFR